MGSTKDKPASSFSDDYLKRKSAQEKGSKTIAKTGTESFADSLKRVTEKKAPKQEQVIQAKVYDDPGTVTFGGDAGFWETTGAYAKAALKDWGRNMLNTVGDAVVNHLRNGEGSANDPTLIWAKENGMLEDYSFDEYNKAVDKREEGFVEGVKERAARSYDEQQRIDVESGNMPQWEKDLARHIGQTANMVPAVATGVLLGPQAASLTLGGQVYGGALGEAITTGATLDAARTYGLMSATAELTIEKVAGGIPGLGDGALTKAASKLFGHQGTKNMMAFIIDTVGEGGEEVASTFLSPYLKRMTYDPNATLPTFEEYLDAFAGGATGSLLLGGGQKVINRYSPAGRLDVLRTKAENADQKAVKAIDAAFERMKNGDVFGGLGSDAKKAISKARTAGARETGSLNPSTVFDGPPPFRQGRLGDAAEPVRVGQVTKIRRPYKGAVPTQVKTDNGAQVVPRPFVDTASRIVTNAINQETGRIDKKRIRKAYEDMFDAKGGQQRVPVNGMQMDGEPYIVDVNKTAVRKVISDRNLSVEKLAVLADVERIIKNGTYVGSGEYEQKGKEKLTVRFDYFETPVTIGGKDYIATFDVEVFPNANNYRTHKVVEKMDLIPLSDADADPVPAANDNAPATRDAGVESNPSVNSIPQNGGKSNNGMNERFKMGQNDTLFSYAGRKAQHADIGTFAKAKRLRRQGATNEQIYYHTGWFVGLDGKWRFEIDDSQMVVDIEGAYERRVNKRIKEIMQEDPSFSEEDAREHLLQMEIPVLTIGEIISHPKLFEQYPDLRDIRVYFEEGMWGGGAYDPATDTIDINKENPDVKGTLCHELQHAIQVREGFTLGSSPEMWNGTEEEKFEQYMSTAGEVEAREVRDRRFMSEFDRRFAMPLQNAPGVIYAEDAPYYQNSKADSVQMHGGEERTQQVKAARQVMEILSSAYGTKFAEFEGPTEINGRYNPKTRTVYINRNSQEPVLGVIAHELIHDLKVSGGETFQMLRQAVNSDLNIDEFYRYKKSLLETYDEMGVDYHSMTESELYDHVLEEAMADLCSEVMRDPETIARIAKKDMTLAQRLVNKLDEIITRIREAFAQFFGGENQEIRNLVQHFDEVKAVYQATLQGLAGKTEGVRGAQGDVKFSFAGKTKSGIRKYKTDFPANMPMDKRIEEFKNRIATIFNLGAVELKTDVKKVQIKGDRFTRKKNLYGDKESTPEEMNAKINSLYDLADILATSEYTGISQEDSYKEPNVPPKNAAHKGVKYWYTFKNKVYVDGVPFDVTFSIRDKGKEQYQYLIDFKEIKKEDGSNQPYSRQATYRQAIDEPSSDYRISQGEPIVKNNIRQNAEGDARNGEKLSVSRKAKAEEAILRYEETGDKGMLPERSWAKGYARDAKKKAQYIENQIQGLEYDLTLNLTQEDEKAVRDAIEVLRAKQTRSHDDAQAAGKLLDLYDADVQHFVDLAPVIDELGDVNKGLGAVKKGLYRFKDARRNFEDFFGKHFGIVEPLLDSFDDGKHDYAEEVVSTLTDLRQLVVKKLGIKPKTKEAAAVQWIAEGERNPDMKKKADREQAEAIREEMFAEELKKGTVRPEDKDKFKPNIRLSYTEEMLIAEFGAERAADIQEAAAWFRGQYDRLIDEINRTRARIYPGQPDKLIHKRKDYMRHFKEISTGFRGLLDIAGMENNISPELVLISDKTKPKKKWQSFEQARTGRLTDEDAISGFIEYLPQAAYGIHIDPFISQFRTLAQDLVKLKAKTSNPDADGFIKYLDDFANYLAGKTSSFDRPLMDLLEANGRTMMRGLNWFNNWTKANAVLGNVASISKQVMNLPNGIVLLENPANILPGLMDVFKGIDGQSDVAAAYKKSGFLKERFMDKAFSKLEKNGLGKGTKWLLGIADEFGTRAIWNAAYREGVKLEKAGEVKDAVRYADNLTRRAVGGRGIGEVPLMYETKVGKLIMPFQLEVSNTWNVYRDVLQGKSGTGKHKGTMDKTLRMTLNFMLVWGMNAALQELTGSKGSFDPLGDIFEGLMQGFGEKEDEDLFDKLLQGGKRAGQNLAGDFLGSRPLGWLAGSVLDTIDEDWSNGTFYAAQGANVPAVQSAIKAGKKFKDGNTVGGAAEIATSFLLPYGGKQLDKTMRGLGDYLRGGNYKNDIYKEFSTGERGDKRYDIEQTVPNAIKSALFGPSSLKENRTYWDEKDRKGYLSSAESKRKQKEAESFFDAYMKAHPDGEVAALYKETKRKEVIPFDAVARERTFTSGGKEQVVKLTDEQLTDYQHKQNKLMELLYSDAVRSEAYKNGDADAKMKILEEARKEAKTRISAMITNDHLYSEPVSRALSEGELHSKQAESEYIVKPSAKTKAVSDRKNEVNRFITSLHNSGRLYDADAESLLSYLEQEFDMDAIDEEVYRVETMLKEAGAGGLTVSGSYVDLLKFTKDGKDYRIPVSAGHMLSVVTETEERIRKMLTELFESGAYQNANVQDKAKMIKKVKKDVRKEVEEGLKRKFIPVRVDEFDKLTRMK